MLKGFGSSLRRFVLALVLACLVLQPVGDCYAWGRAAT